MLGLRAISLVFVLASAGLLSGVALAQEGYRATLTVESRSGSECHPNDAIDQQRRRPLVLAPDPTSLNGDAVEGYLRIDGDHLFYLRGKRSERLTLTDARVPLDAPMDGYVELGVQRPLQEATVVVPFDGGRCVFHVKARLEVANEGAAAARDMRSMASAFAV